MPCNRSRINAAGLPIRGITGQLTIKCPKTGAQIPTGVTIGAADWEIAEFVANLVQCDACGDVHAWDKRDATFEPYDE
jgi:hypothetical protein